jgi:hypothetical protein
MNFPVAVTNRKAQLLSLGRAVSILVDTGNPARLTRSEKTPMVPGSLRENADGSITGMCESSTGDGTVYGVTIHGVERGRIRRVSCSCEDHLHHNWACKHVFRVAKEFVIRGRKEWVLLVNLEEVYNGTR